jgi:ferredoxin--NADP+ reductase
MAHETSERIPLTIADFDPERGTIALVVQEVGKSSAEICRLNEGESPYSVLGPLGHASRLDGAEKVVCVGGGVGIAPVYPIARAYHQKGAELISIIGARTGELLVFEDRMGEISDKLIVCTDDGTKGRKALVTEPLREVLETESGIDRVVAIGPTMMMKFCVETAKPFGVEIVVSLNSIMVDGTGMCGGCRIAVGGETKFCCVDGPEFDGYLVDFDLLMSRQRTYHAEECRAVEKYEKEIGKRE